MHTITVTIAQATEAFGTDDLADHTEQQLLDAAAQTYAEFERRTATGLDTEDQEWRLARIAAALDRL